MYIQKSVILTLLASLVLTGPVMAEGKKLSEKLAGKTIVMTADIQGCDADAKNSAPAWTPTVRMPSCA